MKGLRETRTEKAAMEVVIGDFFHYFFRFHNFVKIILPNLLYKKIRKLIFSKYYKKKKIILKNSYKSNALIYKFFGKKLNFKVLCNDFFDDRFFSYPKMNEKQKIISLIKKRHPLECKNYIDHAEDLLNNNYKVFEKTHNFKKKIDWHYSFLNDYFWDIKPSEKINIRPKYKSEFIDIKYVWEFNRHQFLHYLGIAYYITEHEKYARKFKELLIDWIDKNPPLIGVNWISGLEISIRLITWIFSLWFFRKSKIINNNRFFKKIFKSMFQHAYYLRYFYTRYSFNHTVGDLFGVYFFSKTFDTLKPLKKWEIKLFNKFKKQIFLQTRSDGIDIEQSINYHKFVLEFFTLFFIMNKNNLEDYAINRIQKMFDFLLFIIKPNKKFPLIGDSDDGHVLPLNFYKNNKFNDLINLGSILFHRSDLKYISNKITFLSLLFFGNEGNLIFNKIPEKEPTKNFEYFKKSGFISLRNSWSNLSNYLFLDYGRFGPLHAPHSHSDITNIILSINGKDILIDSGTFSYNKSTTQRILFRSSKSHNILSINSKNQANIVSLFAWKNKPKIYRKIQKKKNVFHFSCSHDGYEKYIVHRRVTISENFKIFEIVDKITWKKKGKNEIPDYIDVYFHFANHNKILLKDNRVFINNDLIMAISVNSNYKLSLIDTYYSPSYGYKLKNITLKIHIKNNPINIDNTGITILTKFLIN